MAARSGARTASFAAISSRYRRVHGPSELAASQRVQAGSDGRDLGLRSPGPSAARAWPFVGRHVGHRDDVRVCGRTSIQFGLSGFRVGNPAARACARVTTVIGRRVLDAVDANGARRRPLSAARLRSRRVPAPQHHRDAAVGDPGGGGLVDEHGQQSSRSRGSATASTSTDGRFRTRAR